MNTKEYDFLMKKFLFKGSFGVVYELRNRETEQKFAMKIINKEKVRLN